MMNDELISHIKEKAVEIQSKSMRREKNVQFYMQVLKEVVVHYATSSLFKF